MSDCPICLETVKTKACSSCGVGCCLPCIETHLLSSEEAACPSCNVIWPTTFLYSILRREFRTGPYQKLREKILFDKEKARLPGTQADAKRCREARVRLPIVKEEFAALHIRIAALPEMKEFKCAEVKFKRSAEYRSAKEESTRAWWEYMTTRVPGRHIAALDALRAILYAWRAGAEEPLRVARAPLEAMRARLELELRDVRYQAGFWGAPLLESEAPKKPKRTFLMKCVQSTCEGFLSEEYKCGLCDISVCSECHEIEGPPPHACDPATVATIRQIRKEAHPCPACAALISKINGCDQMWCTQCNTAFSWTTGLVETGVVHNPHFFQYMRETGQAVPRRHNPGFGCDAVHEIQRTLLLLRSATMTADKRIIDILLETHRMILHAREVELTEYRREQAAYLQQEWRRVLRVKRLLNEIDDAAWKVDLQREEKRHYKITAWVHLLEMYTTVALEAFARVTDEKTAILAYDEYVKIRAYTVQEAKAIAKVFGCVLPICLREPAAE